MRHALHGPQRRLLAALSAGVLGLATLSCFGEGIFGPGDPAVSIELSAAEGRVVVGVDKTLRLGVSGTSARGLAGVVGPVTWSSDQPEIATVSSKGLVTGKQVGDVTIRAAASPASAAKVLRVRTAICSKNTTAGAATLGTPIVGELSLADCAFGNGPLADGWTLATNTTTTIALEVSSPGLEAQVMVTDLTMEPLTNGEGDYSVMDPDGRLVHTLSPGSYLIWATTTPWDTPGEGAYQLSARTVIPCSLATAVSGFSLNGIRVGTLFTADCLLRDGRSADGQVVTVATRTFLGVDAKSADFVPTSLLTTPAMAMIEPSYHLPQDSVEARRIYSLAPGTYVLWSTPRADDQGSGAYSLRTKTLPACVPANASTPITIGETVVDSLTLDDCVREDPWAILGEMRVLSIGAPVLLQIDLTRPAGGVESFVSLWNQFGSDLSVARSQPSEFVSRVERNLTVGTYYVFVSAASGAGPYQLEARQVP